MRRRFAALLPLALALAAVAPAQDRDAPAARYWASRDIAFPVPLDDFRNSDPPPSKLRFFVGQDGGPMRAVRESALTALDDVAGGKKGFRYTTPADGEYDFALQVVYPGDPEAKAPAPQFRYVVDTRPPSVRAAAVGTSGIEWVATDENPDPNGVRLEARWAGISSDWMPIRPRALAMRDRYSWRGITAAQPLEVRVVVRDKADHQAVSRAITLPVTNPGAGLGADVFTPAGRPGDGAPLPNRPQIDYVNTTQLKVTSRLSKVTRSGVQKAYLWVDDGRTGWKREAEQAVNITPDTPDPTIEFVYDVKARGGEKWDGLYGFIVVPVNGAGGKPDDPRPGDQAQFLIEVDTEDPYVKVGKGLATPSPSGVRVEVPYEVRDKNLLANPVKVEYSTAPTGPWTLVAGGLPASGRHVWEADEKSPWRFYVKVTAADKASNFGSDVGAEPVVIDLERPAARIESVRGAGSATPTPRPRPAPARLPGDDSAAPPAPPGPKLDDEAPPVPKLPPEGAGKVPPGFGNYR